MRYFILICVLILFCVFLIQPLQANPFSPQQKAFRTSTPLFSRLMPKYLVDTQNNLRLEITGLFKTIQKTNDPLSYAFLLLLSFAYGIFHAAGPGHRKTIVFSAFITQKTHVWEPAIVGGLVAFFHALTSVLLIMGLYAFMQRIQSSTLTNISQITELVSFGMLAFFVVVLLLIKIYSLFKKSDQTRFNLSFSHEKFYSTILISAIVPCPGVTIMMIFAIYLSMIWQGILAVSAMSLGMGFTISAAGYLAFFSKGALFQGLKHNEQRIEYVTDALEILGYLVILFISVYMLVPFFQSLFS